MGTKIDYKTYFPESKKMRDLNEGTGNCWHPYFVGKSLNDHFYNGAMQNHLSICSGFDKEVLKQTMLEHESIFRKQVYDLHRLYSIQKDMMEKFQEDFLSKFSSLEIPSANISCLSYFGSTCAQPSVENCSSKSGKTRFSAENLSPTSFYESRLQFSSASHVNHAQQGGCDLNSCIRRCPNRMFDLHLPADVYINDEHTEKVDKHLDGSSSLMTTLPFSESCNDNSDVKMKLTVDDFSSCNEGEELNGSNCLADLNQPLKETSLEEETGSFSVQLRARIYGNHNCNCPFRSSDLGLNSAFFHDVDSDGNTSSNVLPVVKEEIIRGGPLSSSESGQQGLCPASGREMQSISFDPIHLKIIEAHQIYGKNPSNSIAVSSSFSVDCNREIEVPNLPQVSTLRKSSGYENRVEDPTVRSSCHLSGFNHGIPADSQSTVINLSCININHDVKGESCFSGTRDGLTVQHNKAASEVLYACESLENTKFSSQADSGLIRIDQSNQVPSELDLHQKKMVVNDLSHASLLNDINLYSFEKHVCVENNRSNFRSYIDLNSEPSLMENQESCQTSNEGLEIKPRQSDLLCVPGDIPLIDLKASNEDIMESTGSFKMDEMLIKEAAENMVNLSMANKPSENFLHLFADIALLNSEITKSNEGCDLFELMTLQLEAMKPEKPWCQPLEREEPREDSLLLARRRRRQAGKKRQKKDFRKDILPGLGKLSRQEAIEDLEAIREMFKASGRPWEVGMVRRKTGRSRMKVLARRRRRSTSAAIATRLLIANGIFDHLEFELKRGCMIQWGRRTRRCRSRRCSPMSISAPLL